jgi:CubicO group peptidase (beta-lactamase class C family)
VRGGYLVADIYFYPYDGTIYHDFASVTKSIMSTLIGIAIDQGKLELDQPVLSFFPDRTIANRDARKERITVRHLLTMSSGLNWDPSDDEIFLNQLRASPDWVQYALDLPMSREPGSRFVYNSANTHLLSAILTQVTGLTALEFAKANLFTPLGIADFHWRVDPQGYNRGWGDLSLHPTDAAKIGFLFLHQGNWDGNQIISRQWVKKATDALIATDRGKDKFYGYGWWVERPKDGVALFAAEGRLGQRIKVIPSMNIVLVVTAQNDSVIDEMDPILVASIGNLEAPLPSNPDGVSRLNSVLLKLKQPSEIKPVLVPSIASSIAGKNYVFRANPLKLESFRIDFGSSDAASIYLKTTDEAEPRIGDVGLDGNYRTNHDGIPWLARGSWLDDHTFSIEFSEGPGLNNFTFCARFESDKVMFEIEGIPNIEGNIE